MAAPFTITSVSNYNSNPPSDDGAQTASNRVQWSTQKTKLADPIKTAFDSSETATSAAFGKIIGGAGFTTTAVDYAVTSSDQGKIVQCTASGHTITTPDATVVGSPFLFGVLNSSSGDITLHGNGSQTIDGALSTTIPAGCGLLVNTDGSNWLTAGQNYNNVLGSPQGRLTPSSGTPSITADVTIAAVYYTPFVGDRVPISTDGVTFKMRQFSELQLNLVSNHLANTVYDVFLFDNSGTLIIGTGPAWNVSTIGSGTRGTGAGTTELQRVHGLFTNKNSMTARNGATTYTVAANQGLYVGSIFIDSVAGQITCSATVGGQNRKWSVWNYFNRLPIRMTATDATTYSYLTNTTRVMRGGTTGSALLVFEGVSEENLFVELQMFASAVALSLNQVSAYQVGIGSNSTGVMSGASGIYSLTNSAGTSISFGSSVTAQLHSSAVQGAYYFYPLENGLGCNNNSVGPLTFTVGWKG